jgi:hypothetical protein
MQDECDGRALARGLVVATFDPPGGAWENYFRNSGAQAVEIAAAERLIILDQNTQVS